MNFVIALMYNFFKIYIYLKDKINMKILKRVYELVIELMESDMTGDEKKEHVRNIIKDEFKNVPTFLIDTMIQVVLVKVFK